MGRMQCTLTMNVSVAVLCTWKHKKKSVSNLALPFKNASRSKNVDLTDSFRQRCPCWPQEGSSQLQTQRAGCRFVKRTVG